MNLVLLLFCGQLGWKDSTAILLKYLLRVCFFISKGKKYTKLYFLYIVGSAVKKFINIKLRTVYLQSISKMGLHLC